MAIREYLDFNIVIERKGEGLYVSYYDAPNGAQLSKNGGIFLQLPDDEDEWSKACEGVERGNGQKLAELGYSLFNAIFTDDLLEQWNKNYGAFTNDSGMGIRLRFSPGADVFAEVPVELLSSDPMKCDFLALNPQISITRSPRHPGEIKPGPELAVPLRILIVIANPNTAGIDANDVKETLDEELEELVTSGRVRVAYLGPQEDPPATYNALHDALVDEDYHIVHFIGHGDFETPEDEDCEGVLEFVAENDNEVERVKGSDLANLLSGRVCFVILQACRGAQSGTCNAFQGVAQRLIKKGVPAVLAMQCPIDTDVAASFCERLYHWWLPGEGLLLEQAVVEARINAKQCFSDRDSATWWNPVLFVNPARTVILNINFQEVTRVDIVDLVARATNNCTPMDFNTLIQRTLDYFKKPCIHRPVIVYGISRAKSIKLCEELNNHKYIAILVSGLITYQDFDGFDPLDPETFWCDLAQQIKNKLSKWPEIEDRYCVIPEYNQCRMAFEHYLGELLTIAHKCDKKLVLVFQDIDWLLSQPYREIYLIINFLTKFFTSRNGLFILSEPYRITKELIDSFEVWIEDDRGAK